MSVPSRVVVRVPATSANLGPGFDCLGLALNLYSHFTFEVLPPDQETIVEVESAWGPDLALDRIPASTENLAYRSFVAHRETLGLPVPPVHIRSSIGMPPGRGLGCSGTAVIGGILAAEALAGMPDSPRRRAELIEAAVAMEHGHHADNVTAALLGGLIAVARDEHTQSWRAIRSAIPAHLRAVVFVPNFSMDTVAGRRLLPEHYSRRDATHNSGHVALLLAALSTGDLDALSVAMDDRFHEPYRAQIYPQLPDLIAAARHAGAYGACLSGGGSSVLAFAADRAPAVAEALSRTAMALQIEGRVVITEIDRQGAVVMLDSPATSRLELVCGCGNETFDLHRTDYRGECGQPLDVDLGGLGSEISGAEWRETFDARLLSRSAVDRSGVWRFRDLLLPLPEVVPVTRPEGQTNLYPVGRMHDSGGHGRIGEFAGVDLLWLKHEGENPTGSFKDRGMTLGVSMAKWLGATAVACASTGNTSASMASYAAQAGMRAIVLLPEGKVAAGKLAQAIAYGSEIRQIAGDFDRAMVDVEKMCFDEGIYLLNSLNPFRILGQQSLAYEVAQQLGWDAPDWIALPAGNLGNTSALGAGLLRAYELGLISRLPRIAAIQASGANPFYRSYLDDFATFAPVKAKTIATAINIGNPVSFPRARAVIEATQGVVAEVTDEEILRAKAVIDRAGVGCEPASAASVAGVRQLVSRGIIQADERVVSVLTGNMLKDPDSITLAQEFALAQEVSR